jgi:hypothetical protein
MLSDQRASNGWCWRIPLDTIDRVVVARLGQTRVSGNAKPAVLNRQIAMYIAKHFGGWSTTRIGRFYNGRDHSTVCYALKRVCALRKDDAELDRLITSLVSEIKNTVARETGRTGSPTWTVDGAKELLFSDAFLDALADRLALRILERANEIDPSSDPSPNDQVANRRG